MFPSDFDFSAVASVAWVTAFVICAVVVGDRFGRAHARTRTARLLAGRASAGAATGNPGPLDS